MTFGSTGSITNVHCRPPSSAAPFFPVLTCTQLAPQSIDFQIPWLQLPTYTIAGSCGFMTKWPPYGQGSLPASGFTGGVTFSHLPTAPSESHLPTGTATVPPAPVPAAPVPTPPAPAAPLPAALVPPAPVPAPLVPALVPAPPPSPPRPPGDPEQASSPPPIRRKSEPAR